MRATVAEYVARSGTAALAACMSAESAATATVSSTHSSMTKRHSC